MKIVLAGLVEHTSGDAVMHSVEGTEHLGIECLGAVLQKAEHQIILQNYFDLEEISKEKPELVGLSVMTFQDLLARRLCKEIKSVDPKIITVVGGPHPSGYPEIVLDHYIDFAVMGEGERTILDLVQYREEKQGLENLRGIAYKFEREGWLVITEPQQFIPNLDSLPWAIRDREVLSVAKTVPGDYDLYGALQPCAAQVYYSRGCPFGCNFCTTELMGGKIVRWRSPQDVVAEMAYIQESYGINYFTFTDLTFNLNGQRVRALCEEIKARKLNIRWFALCSPVIKDLSMYPAMVEAGWIKGGWGLETTVGMRKHLGKTKGDWATIKQTLKLCDKLGVINRIYIMLGYWEANQDITDIQAMLDELAQDDCIDDVKITFTVPFPGTRLWKRWQGKFLTNDFSRWTTEEPILPNPNFQPEKYQQIRQTISKDFFASDDYKRHCERKIKRYPHLRVPFENLWESLKEN